jgi:Na+-translocating ferredoxin:NAD+ oxidoreductase RNF subunit RnfB
MHGEDMVEPLYERESDSVPGPFYVINGACMLCDLPGQTAPQNISWSLETFRRACEDCPDHCRIERQPRGRAELEQVIEAACGSCMEAIRYCGSDPEILERFRHRGYEHLCDAVVRDGA